MAAFKPHKQASTVQELVDIGGDPDPLDMGVKGHSHGYELERTKFGVPKVLYRDRAGQEFLLTVDVYKYEGVPMELMLFCPRCSKRGTMHNLRITQDHKAIDFDPRDNSRLPDTLSTPRAGRLDVERFKCTYELDSSRAVGIVGGTNLCGWSVVIDNNIAREV
jgi:hypothetical protein